MLVRSSHWGWILKTSCLHKNVLLVGKSLFLVSRSLYAVIKKVVRDWTEFQRLTQWWTIKEWADFDTGGLRQKWRKQTSPDWTSEPGPSECPSPKWTFENRTLVLTIVSTVGRYSGLRLRSEGVSRTRRVYPDNIPFFFSSMRSENDTDLPV